MQLILETAPELHIPYFPFQPPRKLREDFSNTQIAPMESTPASPSMTTCTRDVCDTWHNRHESGPVLLWVFSGKDFDAQSPFLRVTFVPPTCSRSLLPGLSSLFLQQPWPPPAASTPWLTASCEATCRLPLMAARPSPRPITSLQ